VSPRPCNDHPTRDLGRTLHAMGLGFRLGSGVLGSELRGRRLVGMRPSVGHVISGRASTGLVSAQWIAQ